MVVKGVPQGLRSILSAVCPQSNILQILFYGNFSTDFIQTKKTIKPVQNPFFILVPYPFFITFALQKLKR